MTLHFRSLEVNPIKTADLVGTGTLNTVSSIFVPMNLAFNELYKILDFFGSEVYRVRFILKT